MRTSAPPAFHGAGTNVLGIHVSAFDLDSATDAILAAVDANAPGYVCFANTHSLIECRADGRLVAIFDGAHFVMPDGMPLVWALRRAGHTQSGRVYGPDVMLRLFDRGREHGLRHYLYGTTPDVLERLAARLIAQFPGAEIVGTHAPPFRPLTRLEEKITVDLINESGADLVWVGLSAPKQERWMGSMRPHLKAPLLLGVGAAFDFHAGLKPQAPAALQRNGLEWAYRLCTEPRRLWRRYFKVVPLYVLLNGAERIGLLNFPGPESRMASVASGAEGR